MTQFRSNFIRAGLGALYFTGAHHLLRPILSGVGAIFMLHHVRPPRDGGFQPNRHLEVLPAFLRAMLSHLRSRGIDIITIDEFGKYWPIVLILLGAYLLYTRLSPTHGGNQPKDVEAPR